MEKCKQTLVKEILEQKLKNIENKIGEIDIRLAKLEDKIYERR